MGTPHQEAQDTEQPEEVTKGGEIEVPWERLDIYGFFPGIWETIKRAMLRPAAFFQAMPVGSGQIKPLIFYLLVAEFQIVLQMLWDMTGMTSSMTGEGEAMGFSAVMLLVGYPIILTMLLYVMAVLVHACLNMVGGATRGFEGTFRALTYGSAPMVLTLIPFVGPLVGAIWSLVVTFLGYKYIHRTTTAKVLLAMLLPLIPFILLLAIVMSMAQRSGAPVF
ncbi:YIP1 family protein [Desulfonatronum lacustre]|uniref:YIP1 family protein n=1 Tax=Desulfonatronum lacustre TaxID=66849 RepID=UPI001FDEC9F9|nr:YIP1 family protein [Desulfonatronum lacustre]